MSVSPGMSQSDVKYWTLQLLYLGCSNSPRTRYKVYNSWIKENTTKTMTTTRKALRILLGLFFCSILVAPAVCGQRSIMERTGYDYTFGSVSFEFFVCESTKARFLVAHLPRLRPFPQKQILLLYHRRNFLFFLFFFLGLSIVTLYPDIRIVHR